VAEALSLLPKRAHGTVVVVDEGGRPIGTVDEAACTGVDRFTRLATCSTRPRSPCPSTPAPRRVRGARRARHRARARAEGRLAGLLTALGALRAGIYTPALDAAGRLRTAAAVGINGDVAVKAKALLAAGVDVLVVDTAHGHQDKMLDALAAVRAAAGRTCRWRRATSSPPKGCATSPRRAPTSSRSASGRARCAPRG
jgi:IMP dehydrogenase